MKKRVSKTLYEKRGRRYVSVGKDDFILPYGVGDWLVQVRRGTRRYMAVRKRKVKMDWARVELALHEAEAAVAKAIMKHSALQPKVVMNTPREQRAFEAYKRIVGAESLTLNRKSAQEVARLAVMVLREGLENELCPNGCMRTAADREVTGV